MATIDLYGVGNALVDTEYEVPESFLDVHELSKGHMTLVDGPRLNHLLNVLETPPVSRSSGGSAANTLYAAQGFGSKTFMSCRISRDESGRHFAQDFLDAGIGTNLVTDGAEQETGRCLVLVTPDAERTLNTHLGISEQLCSDQLTPNVITDSECLYIEGYLASSTTGCEAAINAHEIASAAERLVCLTLSDTSMVESFKGNLIQILGDGIDRLFCNAEEALAWSRTDRIDIAINELRDIARQVVVTVGSRGCVLANKTLTKEVPGIKVEAIDVNGAGDMFAGAFLASSLQGAAETEAARFANYAAAMHVTTYGSRLQNTLAYRKLRKAYPNS